MWIPRSEAEIRDLAESDSIEESASFDAKRDIPHKSKSTAIDIAAMANDGGVLLYGLGEDDRKRPTVLAPIRLKGAAERLNSIIQTCIAEPPPVAVQTIVSNDDPELGYLVVVIPPSQRAPHMVIVDREHRYYGRGPAGNVLLSEGDVARLYARRTVLERDLEVLRENLIAHAPLALLPGSGHLHILIRPVLSDTGLLTRTAGSEKHAPYLRERIRATKKHKTFSFGYSPDFHEVDPFQTPDGWIFYMHDDPRRGDPRKPRHVLDLFVGYDGQIRLFCGRAVDLIREGQPCFLEAVVAGLSIRALSLAGAIYRDAKYLGSVDVLLALSGIRDAPAHWSYQRVANPSKTTVDQDEYWKHQRLSAMGLQDSARQIADSLLAPLLRALTQHPSFGIDMIDK